MATKHAKTLAQAPPTDETIVGSDDWNADHNSPEFETVFLAPGSVHSTTPTQNATQEYGGVDRYRVPRRLTECTQAKLLTSFSSVFLAGTALRLQYTTDLTGATGWAYLDGASGPSVAADSVGNKDSGWVTLTGAAKADVLLRPVFVTPAGTSIAGSTQHIRVHFR